jgi:hypothetical protein
MLDRPATPTTNSKDSPAGSPIGGCDADATSPARPDQADAVSSPAESSPKQRAVAYVRESTEEQGQGFSPDAQHETIRKFPVENDLELTGEYCDFHSGWRKSEARPEFQRLMADAAEGRFDVVSCSTPRVSLAARSSPGATSSSYASGSGSASSPSPSRWARTRPTPPRSSPSRSTRCSTSTTPSRCPSGPAAGCTRRRDRDTLSGCSRGDTAATPPPSSPSTTPSAPCSCVSCSSATPPDRSPTARSPRG